MARVGTISIDLVAHTGKLLAPLKQSSNAIAAFATGTKAVHAGMGSLIARVGALTGGILTAYTAWTKVTKAFEEVDVIAKLSDRLGMSTEKLIGLQHAAGLAGVSSDELGSALDFMLRKGKHAGELAEIADKMAGMSDATERAKLAVETFGRSGIGMVNVLAGGSAGLAEMQADAEKLGLTLSRVDAAHVELANDAVSRLTLMFDGLARTIAIELSPFIKAAADHFVNLGTEGEGWGGKVRAAIDLVVDGLAFLADAVFAVQVGWGQFQIWGQQAMAGVISGLATLTKGVEMFSEATITGFRALWGSAVQLAADAIGSIIRLFADFATWVDSKLPERFRVGVGAAAQAFSEGFDAAAESARTSLESTDFSVDFKFGDTALEFSKTLNEDVSKARKEFLAFASGPMPSAGIRRGVEKLRADAEAAARGIAEGAPTDIGTATLDVKPAALERGSQEAFSAFSRNMAGTRSVEEKILEEEKKSLAELKKISRHLAGGGLLIAPGL